MRHHRHSHARTRGFTLLEALVALLVLSFGMLAIAGFQVTLSRSADLAKQRTEATRLAQKQVEKLRSFVQAESDTVHPPTHLLHKVNYTDDVVNGTAATIANNATFNLTWTVTANAADTEKSVNVLVTWDDRTGQSQSVQLLSVIAKFDPQSIGTLATGPGGTGVRYPKNRNINIPFPVVGLQGDARNSAFIPPPGNVLFVFDNITGQIVQRCTGTTTLVLGSALLTEVNAARSSRCTNLEAFLLSGYVRFKGTTPGYEHQVDADELENPSNVLFGYPDTKELAPNPLLVDDSDTGNAPTGYECFAQRRVTVRSTGAAQPPEKTIAESDLPATIAAGDYTDGAPFSAPRFIAYVCVVTPNNVATPKSWSGQVNLVPDPSAASPDRFEIGPNPGQRKVCRFTSDYDGNTRLSNREHPRYYRGVTGALSNQDFLVIANQFNCPTDSAATPLTGDFVDSNTASHQPTAALSPNEPPATTPIPMN